MKKHTVEFAGIVFPVLTFLAGLALGVWVEQ